jgi:sulfotransferase family protein
VIGHMPWARSHSARELDAPKVVFIMGTARSGSTLLGTLLGESDGVFFGGELCDWPKLQGISSVPHSRPFWEKVRTHLDSGQIQGPDFKRLFEHPAGIFRQIGRRRDRQAYRRLTVDVLKAVAKESGRSVIVDSSHYPLRARALRRFLSPGQVRLVFLVRRPSSVAESFRKTGDKGVIQANAYMMLVSVLAWLAYVTHPRDDRVIIRYEHLIQDPLGVGGVALGRPLQSVNPYRMAPPLVLIGNRFVKNAEVITFERSASPTPASRQERISDLVQWPLWLAARAARSRPAEGQASGINR